MSGPPFALALDLDSIGSAANSSRYCTVDFWLRNAQKLYWAYFSSEIFDIVTSSSVALQFCC
jgi:hypothetical protein